MKTPTTAQRLTMRLMTEGWMLRRVGIRWRLYAPDGSEWAGAWEFIQDRVIAALRRDGWLSSVQLPNERPHFVLTDLGRAALAAATTTAPAADTDAEVKP